MSQKPWKLHPAIAALRSQINTAWPDRSKASDGTIGDAAHSARASDHNPNEDGLVCAIDITDDPANGCDAGALADALRASRDKRLKYVIFSGRLFSSTFHPWRWRVYTGPNKHTKHVHISVNANADASPWQITQPSTVKERE